MSDDLTTQKEFWNRWNADNRESAQGMVSHREASVVVGWIRQEPRAGDLDLLEVGCGTGWFSEQLVPFGRVVATDLADEVIGRARERCPEVTFLAGDFLDLDLPAASADVVVTLEVLSHVADQPRFFDRVADVLRPGGHLLLATQNRPVLERWNTVPPPSPGQLRRWVDEAELRRLLAPRFDVLELSSICPIADHGVMRLVNSWKLNAPVRAVAGDRVERWKERRGWGWMLMARAERRRD